MATPFRLKRSAVSNKRPALADLELGELAFNFTMDTCLQRETQVGVWHLEPQLHFLLLG